jgi:hypothetical protein
MRCRTEYISRVLFMGTRKSFSPTDSSIGVLKLRACITGLCAIQTSGFSQGVEPIISSRP